MSAAFRRHVLRAAIALFAVALAGGLGYSLGRRRPQTSGPAGAQLPVLRAAPHYVLSNQLGQRVDSTSFEGKVQIVTFLFPYCTTYCPLVAANLVRFEHDLKGTDLASRVRIVAFNVDPEGSRAPQLRAFMREYDWDPRDTHWQFLTGSPSDVRRVVYRGFMVYYKKESLALEAREAARERARGTYLPQPTVVNPLAEKANAGYDIVHNDVLEIVGPRGNIREIFDDAERVSEQELFAAVRALT